MTRQTDINSKMRAILIDWLVEVHLKFKLRDETLFLTVNIIDRYLSCVVITRDKLQLVGVTALLISSKFEEIYFPELKEFVDITDKTYTKEQILEMEGRILHKLNFELNATSSLKFLDRYTRVHNLDLESEIYMKARYLLELVLIEYGMVQYPPSKIAVSALCVACKLSEAIDWSSNLEKACQYNRGEIISCMKDMVLLLHRNKRMMLYAVKNKFSLEKYGKVSETLFC